MKKAALLVGIIAALGLMTGCLIGPKYKRPAANVPQEYRAPAPQQAAQASSLGNEQWWQVYQDPVLTQLIHTAIAQNYDVRIAAARVLEAQAQVGITRANQLPSASVGADVFSEQNAKVTNLFPAYQVNGGELNLSVIWNLDFWGKYRRQTEAARAQLLASEWGQRAVISSLVANVATAYFQLRALDNESHAGVAAAIPKADSGPRKSWFRLGARRESSRATRLHGFGDDSRPRTANSAAGKRAERSAW
jgi:multidrug efflux system outer membrane protein